MPHPATCAQHPRKLPSVRPRPNVSATAADANTDNNDREAAAAEAIARLFPGGEFSVQMQVRDYELDQFSVVNNGIYSSYLQHARHEAFALLGHDVDSYARSGSPLALSQLNISFRAPLRSRDVFRTTVVVTRVTAARLVMQQRILRALPPLVPQQQEQPNSATLAAAGASVVAAAREELVVEAEATVVFLDNQYRAARVPRVVAKLFQMLADARTSSLPPL